ncbi:hypothetical protein DK853_53165, partial [Klebsiella oxytoca]
NDNIVFVYSHAGIREKVSQSPQDIAVGWIGKPCCIKTDQDKGGKGLYLMRKKLDTVLDLSGICQMFFHN